MINCEAELDTLLEHGGKSSFVSRPKLQDEVVRIFDDTRAPLLRFLSAFPLAMPDAEDVLQETFLALFQQLQRGKSFHNVRGWLFRAAHHLAIKKRTWLRINGERIDIGGEVEQIAIDSALNPEDECEFNERQRRLAAVVRALPQLHRQCLHLRAEGMRYREISDILDMSLGAVSLSLARSLALIGRAAQR